jgi:predicted nucleic acid-binding protein
VKYLLDSTVLIDYAIGYGPGKDVLTRLFSTSGELYTCDVVSCEALSKGRSEELRLVRSLLDALEYVAINPDGARWAGDQRRAQLDAGRRKPSLGDSLLAGLAWALSATIVTRNARDFEAFGIPVLGYGPKPAD